MALLAQGNLAAARAWLTQQPPEQEAANLAYFGAYWDLVWIFDAAQREAFLRLPAEAFGGNSATRALAFAQVHALGGDPGEVRRYSEEGEREFRRQRADAPDDDQLLALHGLSLAYLGRRDEAIRQGERAVAVMPISRDPFSSAYIQRHLVRIYMILGEREKALDRLEPVLEIPYLLSPGWLAIDPIVAPLKGHPRVEKLLRR
jgi:tetratricopeptide (TPR) repeat protein